MIGAETETPAPPFVTPSPLPVNIANRHLGYVITWFGLAAALAGVYAAMLMKRLKP
jgi:surfeit locus 1 family protein